MNLTNEPSLKGSLMNSHGFELVTERRLHEVGGTARLWKHGVTGSGFERFVALAGRFRMSASDLYCGTSEDALRAQRRCQ